MYSNIRSVLAWRTGVPRGAHAQERASALGPLWGNTNWLGQALSGPASASFDSGSGPAAYSGARGDGARPSTASSAVRAAPPLTTGDR